MLFRQILHDDLGCASYVVACGGHAAVVDPQWDIEPYLQLAAEQRLQITDILLTHNHADHVSGHGRLVAATGARVHVSADADAGYPHEPLRDGDSVTIGTAELRALATPGHRPEHLSFLLIDHARSDEPWALLAGDFVFVGDLARPDLAVELRDGAADIHRSLRRLDGLPDGIEIWPGHTGGSLCGGAGMSRKPSSTLGFERSVNALVRMEDRSSFVDQITEGLSAQPPNFQRIAEHNRSGPATQLPPTDALAPARVSELLEAGAVLIDVREPHEYDSGHVPGSLNVTATSAGVGTRTAWLVPPDQLVIVCAATAPQAGRALLDLHAAGVLNTLGFLDGGIEAWRVADMSIETTPAIDVQTLARQLERSHDLVVVDVRDEGEWDDGHLDGSVHAPFHALSDGLPARLDSLPRDTPIAVACAAGTRSALAASHLRRAGFTNVEHVAGGGIPDLPDHHVHLATGAAPND